MNQWLQNEYKLIQNMLTDELIRQGNYAQAITRMKAVMLLDSFDEENIYKLIATMFNTVDTTSAKIIYEKYHQNLWQELNLVPSEKRQKLISTC